jgi:hypothetical protein
MDSGMTALVLGFFALLWFSWGPEASGMLIPVVAAGSAAAVLIAVLGAIRAYRGRGGESTMNNPIVRRHYGIVVGIEFALIGLGAVTLGAIGAGAYIPVWICAVVGLHLFPLAAAFGAPEMRWLGAVLTAVAATALLVGIFTDVAPRNLTGLGAGLAMLASGTLALAQPARLRVTGSSATNAPLAPRNEETR